MSNPTHAQLEYLQNAGQNFGYAVGFSAPAEHVHELQRAVNEGEFYLLGSSVVDIACSNAVVKEMGRPGKHEGSIILGERTKITPFGRLVGCYVENAVVATPILLAQYAFIDKWMPFALDPNRMRAIETVAVGAETSFTFDTDSKKVCQGDTAVPLTPTQFNIAHMFISNLGKPLPLQTLADAVKTHEGSKALVRTHISNTIRKLQEAGLAIEIRKERGSTGGYVVTYSN